jgi:murein DD-endopeptidase MepM/ murein hydrolase activator NlpD
LTRSDITRGVDTAESLLARLGVRDPAAVQMLRNDRVARSVLSGRGGKMVQAKTAPDGSLQELVARFPAASSDQARTHFTRLTLRHQAGQWTAEMNSVPFGSQVRLSSGSIRSSLFAATDEAGLPDSVAIQLAEIFSADIDFHRELRKGDTFSLVYEALTADGEPVAWNEGAGRVLAAEFVNGGRTHQALWFTGSDGRGGYYGADGQSRRRAFLASPMEFSRVTSGFAMRFHPILQRVRQHNGVDYGAPIGTPVRSVADGIVEFAGTQNGYGKVVEVRHGKDRSTLYAHLSAINVTKGQRVEQGQNLGAVGMTGMTTGPHLHFEFRVNGVHQDPLNIARGAETLPVDAAAKPRFEEMARQGASQARRGRVPGRPTRPLRVGLTARGLVCRADVGHLAGWRGWSAGRSAARPTCCKHEHTCIGPLMRPCARPLLYLNTPVRTRSIAGRWRPMR